MKYLFLLLFLTGCTTLPKSYEYNCAAVGAHGVYAKWTGQYASEVEAYEDGEKVRLNLVKQDLIPDNTGTICYLAKDELPRKMPGEHPADN